VLSPSSPSIAKGTSQAFVARATYSDGTVQNLTSAADWTVADLSGSGVASIDGDGIATGLALGQATISAAYGGKTASTTLTVTAATLTSLAVTPSAASVPNGTTQRFVATATFSDGSTQDVSNMGAWTATDLSGTSVAEVGADGLATGHAVGT